MTNGNQVRSGSLVGFFFAALLASLTLWGCGGGGGGGEAEAPPISLGSSPPPSSGSSDTTPPTVSDTSPSNAATGVALNSSISATFSEPMTNSTLSTASFKLAPAAGGAAVTGVVVVNGNTAMFVPSFAPSNNLTPSTQYTATITTAAKDAAGNALAASYAWSFTTGTAPDITPPTVSTISPARGATGVATNSSVSATFSEAMTNSTLNETSFTLVTTTGGGTIGGTITVNGNTARFTPFGPLVASTQYTATISAGVTDAAGNPLAADFTWNFTTAAAPDTSPPTVTSTTPASAATGAALNSSVSATFSEPMTNSTLNTTSFTLRRTGGSAVSGTVSIVGNTAAFTPSANLAGSTQYTATITTGARDAAGNAMAANFVWSFTTAAAPDTTPPTVSSTLPTNSMTGVALNTTVSATFSEAMKNSTLTNASFTLVKTTDGTAVTGTVNVSGNTATFTPSASLSPSTQYTGTITTTAQDAAGNPMAANYSWVFMTTAGDTTPPTVSATSPTFGATGVALNTLVSATFSEAMSNATLTTTSFTLKTSPGGVAVTGTVSVSGTTATFTPTAPLVAGTYTATITTGAKDAAGNALAANFAWSFTTTQAPATTATLMWDAATAATGYRVYYGTAPGVYLQALGQGFSVGNVLTYTVTGLSSGTRYYFAVTAVDTLGNESGYSNEVFKDIP